MKKITVLTLAIMLIVTVLSVGVYAEDVTPDDYIAYFSFDNADSGLAGGGAYATPNNKTGEGAAVVIDNDEKHSGDGSLRLDNSDPDALYWLEVWKDDNSSLLTGQNELTISFWSNTTGVGPSWSFFACPIINDGPWLQIYRQEYYIGLLENQSVVAQRFCVTGAEDGVMMDRTPELVGDQFPNEWKLVTVTFDDAGYTLYVNGEWMSEYVLMETTLPDLLREESMFYIGCSTWVTQIAGENFVSGWIDDFYVYPYAMTEQQVASLCVAQGGEAPSGYVATGSEPADTEAPQTEAPATDAPSTDVPQTDAPQTDAPETDAPEEKGCGSSFGIAAVVTAVTATLGCAVIRKRH